MQDKGLTHFDKDGRPRMVDVSEKPPTQREAEAEARVRMARTTRQLVEDRALAKGDVTTVAELAGIMAAKRTADLIPLCHPLPLTKVHVTSGWLPQEDEKTAVLQIRARIRTTYSTGVEMEALTACSIAALTVYDMCKAVDREMTIECIRLLEKSGGQSGEFRRLD
ncbi:MAG: cyclic pyranopterin monophosphate synthase MoaC [Alicyclobacillus herbarius]|uniref:cyclic pyranopterin monophosphate synthase MoaC n=1 Tax=Alicyclobacillus herbarius TaxID=122960 RepID=UPI0023545CF2|nr:cyclic pyranopterin monophosphate synthase MoaC [Alicyclobacillus herbarius]MCL6631236.1 cyclic pyranopterin monophosphate synthase MoaC [Alicyclobacillus herbarius]